MWSAFMLDEMPRLRLAGWQNEVGVAVLPLSTAEDPVLQLQRLLGGLASPRRVER